MALGLIEAGARAVYCIDVHKIPGDDWQKTRLYAEKMQCKAGEGRLEYLQGDVTDQVRRLFGTSYTSIVVLMKEAVGKNVGDRRDYW